MRSKTRSYLVLLSLFSMTSSANSVDRLPNATIKVFTSQHYTIQQPELAKVIYQLDSVEKLEESFLSHLSTDPAQAEKQVKQVMNTPVWKTFENQLKNAYQGVIEGWKLGVMKVPAVVFEMPDPTQSSVIYGETDVGRAIERYLADSMERGKTK